MKQLLITIAALVLEGCGEKDYSGYYWIEKPDEDWGDGVVRPPIIAILNLKKDQTATLKEIEKKRAENFTWSVNDKSLIFYKRDKPFFNI